MAVETGKHANGRVETGNHVNGHAEAPKHANGHVEAGKHVNGHAGEALHVVVQALADATRHPVDLLVPDARLEEDLGVDRRRRDELRALLRQRGAQPAVLEAALDEARTVGDLARLVESAPSAQVAAARAPAAPAAQRAPSPPASRSRARRSS